MVVAARAGRGEPHEPARNDVDAVIDDVLLVVEKTAADGQKTHGGQRRRIGLRLAQHELIGGELLDDELVVRQVGVQRLDDPIAIGVRVRELALLAGDEIAARVGVARDIEPMPAPALAVAGRGEEPVDHLREGIGRLVLLEGLDLRGGRRQADEIERGAAQQRALVGARRRREFGGFHARERELVDRRLHPVRRVRDRRRRGIRDRLKGPVMQRAILLRRERALVRLGPRQAELDPLRERGDLLLRQLRLLGRHVILRLVPDALDERALIRLARHRRGNAIGPFQDRLARIEAQIALLLFGSMALVAMLHEHRPHLGFKELDLRRGRGAAVGAEREEKEGE